MSSTWAWPAPHGEPELPAWDSLAREWLEGRLEPKLELRWRPEILAALEELYLWEPYAAQDGWRGSREMNHAHIALGIPGMDKDSGARVKKQLEAAPGVYGVTVWESTQQIDVDYSPALITPAAIEQEIRQVGFEPVYMQYAQRWPG